MAALRSTQPAGTGCRAPAAATRCPGVLRSALVGGSVCNKAAVGRSATRQHASVNGASAQVDVHPASGLHEPAALDRQSPASSSHDQQQVDWFSAWYPIAFSRDLDKTQLTRFTLLEIPLVLWWDAGVAAWRAFKDECPHRLVPLSEGRINQQGQLECGYHGWAFSGDGSCTRIPQGGNVTSPRACATAFACEEHQGLLFVYPQPLLLKGKGLGDGVPDPATIPIVPELEDPSWTPQDTWRDLPYDFSILLENVLDSSHVPFTHHKSMSNRNVLNNYNMQLVDPVSKLGFTGFWKDGPRAGTLGPQHTEFKFPCFMKHKMEAAAVDNLVCVYAVPIKPGRCRLINRNAVKLKGGASLVPKILRLVPGWMIHLGTSTLLEDDQIFLHHGELEVAARKAQGQQMGQAYFTPSPADTYVLAFHRWLDKFGGGGPFGPVDLAYIARLGPRLSREQLLDRFSQHTAGCAECQRGMAQVSSLISVLGAAEKAFQSAALLCLATAAAGMLLSPAPGVELAADAPLSVGRAAPSLASLLLSALSLLVGAQPTMEQLVVRGAAFGLAAWASSWLVTKATELKASFSTGVYPPPRNVAKD